MMDSDELRRIINHGFKYGHHHNPKYPILEGFTPEGLMALPRDHELITSMVKSVQESDGNLNAIAMSVHRRDVIIDGDPGPATLALVSLPRCACKDFEPATDREQQRSSWKKGCVPEFPDLYAIVMGLEVSRMQSVWRDNLDEIIAAITKAENEIGYHVLWKKDLSGQSHMKISWGPIAGGVIGWNTVPNSFSCGLSITGKIDTTWDSDIKRLGRLGLHEWMGHGFGFGHYPGSGSIMNPSITPGEISWIGDRLEQEMLALADGPIAPPGGGLGDWGTDEWL